jgi:hypothetical protein
VGTAANSVGTGNQADEAINRASMVGGGAGIIGSIANLMGVGTGVSELFGLTAATGEVAATTAGGAAIGGAAAAGGVIGAGAAGWGYGNLFNDTVKDMGLAGQDSAGNNRSFSDMSGDHGWAVHEAITNGIGGDDPNSLRHDLASGLGHVAGLGTVLGESVLGTAGAVVSAPAVIGRALWNGVSGLF